jgi:hypothetical protein
LQRDDIVVAEAANESGPAMKPSRIDSTAEHPCPSTADCQLAE